MVKYIMLVIYPDGDRYWQHWNVKELALEALEFHKECGAIGQVIKTENYEENACIF